MSVAGFEVPCGRSVRTVIVAVPEPLAGGENSISRSRCSVREEERRVRCRRGDAAWATGVSSQLFIAASVVRAVQSASSAAPGAGLMNDPAGPLTVILEA